MGKLFDRFDVEPIKGVDITIGRFDFELFVSKSDALNEKSSNLLRYSYCNLCAIL